MPNDAFYKLDNTKREKILEAIKEEFGCNSFEKASVSKIAKKAGISKGSFWFYFENKEEAINFIITEYINQEEEKIFELLKKNNGDLFESYIDYYDFLVEQPYNWTLIKNIFKELLINDKKILQNVRFKKPVGGVLSNSLSKSEKFNSLIDLSSFKFKDKEHLLSVLRLLNFSLRSSIKSNCFEKENNQKESREEFVRQIKIIKNGI